MQFVRGDGADPDVLAGLQGPFDVILLVNVVTHLADVQAALEALHPLCHARTRIVIYSYSRLWQPILRLAEIAGMKYRQPPEAWLPPEEIRNMLGLADFETRAHGRADRAARSRAAALRPREPLCRPSPRPRRLLADVRHRRPPGPRAHAGAGGGPHRQRDHSVPQRERPHP